MMKPKIYISGPISGCDLEERRAAFEMVEERLQEHFEVFNPMKNGVPAEADTRRHMHRDLAELTREDEPYLYIYMMERWTHSAGCRLEFEVATAIGITVIFEEGKITKFV